MPNFMWANDHQIIDTEKITVLNVDADGKTGTAYLNGYNDMVILNGTDAQIFIKSLARNRFK